MLAFAEFDAASWDQQIAADDAAGRLDWLVQEARDDMDVAAALIDETSSKPAFLAALSGLAGRASALRGSSLSATASGSAASITAFQADRKALVSPHRVASSRASDRA